MLAEAISMGESARHELIADLKERLRAMERSGRKTREPAFATGTPLDRLLPEKGFERGTLIEWLSAGEGSGAMTLALITAARLLTRGGAFVVVDGKCEFYPVGAAGLGIPLERTVIVRPANLRDALWAWEHSLRSSAVAVALGWIDGLKERAFRRLQLAAEAGGGLGFLLRPDSCRAEPSWAEARLLVSAVPMVGGTSATGVFSRRLHVEVLRCRGGASGRAVELELSDEEVHVHLASQLAHPAAAWRATGA
jgi:protein ImuA